MIKKGEMYTVVYILSFLSVITKERIEKLRESSRESYDDILRKILYTLNLTREDPSRAKRFLERVDELRKRMLEVKEQEEIEKKAAKKAKAQKKVAKKKTANIRKN
jgi:DNA-binding SARP family transcriptional activator